MPTQKIDVSKQMVENNIFSIIRMSKAIVRLMLEKVRRESNWTKTELLNMAREIIDDNPLIYITVKCNVKEDIPEKLESLYKFLEHLEKKYYYNVVYVDVPTYPPNKLYVLEEFERYVAYSPTLKTMKLRVSGLIIVGGKNPEVMFGTAPASAPKLEGVVE